MRLLIRVVGEQLDEEEEAAARGSQKGLHWHRQFGSARAQLESLAQPIAYFYRSLQCSALLSVLIYPSTFQSIHLRAGLIVCPFELSMRLPVLLIAGLSDYRYPVVYGSSSLCLSTADSI